MIGTAVSLRQEEAELERRQAEDEADEEAEKERLALEKMAEIRAEYEVKFSK